MGCVDKADMYKTLYQINRKSKKSWHRILWHFVDVALVNSFIIYKLRNPNTKIKLKDFRLAVANELVDYSSPKNRGKKPLKELVRNHKQQVPDVKRFSKEPHIPGVMEQRR